MCFGVSDIRICRNVSIFCSWFGGYLRVRVKANADKALHTTELAELFGVSKKILTLQAPKLKKWCIFLVAMLQILVFFLRSEK